LVVLYGQFMMHGQRNVKFRDLYFLSRFHPLIGHEGP